MTNKRRMIALFISLSSAFCFLQAAEIHEAVKAGDLAKMKNLIEKDPALVKAKDETGRTPLHWAAQGMNIEILRYLIEMDADINILDNNGSAPLHIAASRGIPEAVRVLIETGADINIKDPNKITPLHHAAERGREAVVRLLIEKKADLESRNAWERTPLIAAARERGGVAIVRALLDAGAAINAADRAGDTALQLAAWRGYTDVVDLLIERGADVPVNTLKGRQLLESAVSTGIVSLFSKIVEKGADLNIEIGDGRTLFHAAAEGGAVPILAIMIDKKLDISKKDENGWAPLHFATDMGRKAAVGLLLGKGADINARTMMGQTAYNIAEENGDKDIAAVLAARGADQSPDRFPALSGDYMGQKKPGKVPEIFAKGIVSARYGLHSNVVFSPDGKEAFWSVSIPPRGTGYGSGRTLVSRLVDGRWTYPRPAVYEGIPLSDVPFFHPEGRKLFDMSARPYPGGRNPGKENIWVWDKSDNGWTNSRPVDAAVNNLPLHWQFSVDREGNICFNANIPGSRGGSDIYISRFISGRYEKPENLGDTINTPEGEEFPFIAPDGSYLIFGRNGDLYLSSRGREGTWSEAKRLGPDINTPSWEMLPMVSPDGKWLFFSRNFKSYWADAAVFKDLK